jgi:hypothetical protein
MYELYVAIESGCDCTTRRRKQVDNEDMGSILREQEAGEHPEWKDITDCGPVYNSYLGPVEKPDGERCPAEALLGIS